MQAPVVVMSTLANTEHLPDFYRALSLSKLMIYHRYPVW